MIHMDMYPGTVAVERKRTRLRRLQGNRDESPNPMCAPARSITRGVHHSEPPFSFLPARGPLVPRLTFEITNLFVSFHFFRLFLLQLTVRKSKAVFKIDKKKIYLNGISSVDGADDRQLGYFVATVFNH